jgi:V8-like Glu-specific endopeptidase
LLWTSPKTELDATLLEIESLPEKAAPPPLALELPSKKGENSRVNIIGYPSCRDLQVSLQDNKIVKVKDPYIHYKTPTDPGSSGSPVFDQSWNLVALHHAASYGKGANEGVRMDRIIETMRKELL